MPFPLLLLLVLFAPDIVHAQPADEVVYYVFTEIASSGNSRLTTVDEAEWRIMEAEADLKADTDAGTAVIILLGGEREGRSGIAYVGGEQYSVSLLSGNPARKAGRRYGLLFADAENRSLTLTNGEVRRVMDTDINLDFPSDRLVELILTSDRQHLLDTSRGLRMRVSPALRP